MFLDDIDRKSFLELLGSVVYRYRWVCCAYCLMRNHYHLLVDTSVESLSGGMKLLDGTYSRRFNSRYRRSGQMIRVHFMVERIDNDYRFLNAVKYIARNPLEAGVCCHPGEWSWSSYNATAGILPGPQFLDVGPVLDLFSKNDRTARFAYIDFVSGDSPEAQSEARSRYYSSTPVVTCKIRERSRPTLESLFKGCDSLESRNRAIHQAHRVFGYTLAEIGESVGLSVSMVCKISSGVGRLNHSLNNG